ncbi:relaxase/mobilization nuclease domain-containing protein [Sphingomonas sp. 28-62-20]|uniref:relaxase/mobilization nuclease domain-containing protein n=1 Tax=Sphingomonas sp. 28-62-20 TaxID=1970433 RepID=UPI0035A86495
MDRDNDLRIRPGRIRSTRVQRTRPIINQVLAATRKAGGHVTRKGTISSSSNSRFGRGKVASVVAMRGVSHRSRNVIIKARVVRQGRTRGALAAHVNYLQRDGVTRDGEKGRLFGAEGEEIDRDVFADRCADDRHHFRFIVSPEDAIEMVDLKDFTRDLMVQMQKDLGTHLDWVAVEHWNTGQPHIHIIVRGIGDDARDLVIARDYIGEGMRAQARNLVTQELGLRTDLDISRALERQIDVERWTNLDRSLTRTLERDGMIDLGIPVDGRPDDFHVHKMGRLHKLERLGLASEIDPGVWVLHDDAEASLREMGTRGDIIKRMHRALGERGIEREVSAFELEPDIAHHKIIGRMVDRGLHDELNGTAYAIIDGIDGRTHHVVLPDLDATGDAHPGSIVELRQFEDRKGKQRVALAVRSEMDLSAQIDAPGVTWLDRRNLASDGHDLGGGFGREVEAAMEARAEHLIEEGLARRHGQRIVFARDLLATLERGDIDRQVEKLAREIGLPHRRSQPGEYVMGTVRERITLASGRYAMIDDGLGFSLVPWTPSLDNQLGKHISGVMRDDGGVDWSFGRKRELGV